MRYRRRNDHRFPFLAMVSTELCAPFIIWRERWEHRAMEDAFLSLFAIGLGIQVASRSSEDLDAEYWGGDNLTRELTIPANAKLVRLSSFVS